VVRDDFCFLCYSYKRCTLHKGETNLSRERLTTAPQMSAVAEYEKLDRLETHITYYSQFHSVSNGQIFTTHASKQVGLDVQRQRTTLTLHSLQIARTIFQSGNERWGYCAEARLSLYLGSVKAEYFLDMSPTSVCTSATEIPSTPIVPSIAETLYPNDFREVQTSSQ